MNLKSVRIMNICGKKDAVLGNIVIEVSKSVCDKLVCEGKMY